MEVSHAHTIKQKLLYESNALQHGLVILVELSEVKTPDECWAFRYHPDVPVNALPDCDTACSG